MKTKDYSKVKYVKPSVDGDDITKGKVYAVVRYIDDDLFKIKDDVNFKITISLGNYEWADTLSKARYNWIPCDKDGNEI